MKEYTIRKLKHEEFDILLPLMRDCFGMDADIGYFKWKFLDNPAGFVEGFVAIADDDEIAAYYGVIPEQYVIDGEMVTIYQSCDTMTHSRHRRKGLFEKLAKHCFAYLQEQDKLFIIGFAGGKSAPGFYKFGWKAIFPVRHYFIPKVLCWTQFGLLRDEIFEIEDLSRIESSILHSNRSRPIHSHKTLANFKWRVSNPLHNYRTIGYSQNSRNGECKSWLTYYLTPGNIVLFDFFFENGRAAKMLMGHLKNILKQSDKKGIVAFCQEGGAYAKQLLSRGFITNPFNKGPLSFRTPFIIYADERRMAAHSDRSKWLISSYDYDAM